MSRARPARRSSAVQLAAIAVQAGIACSALAQATIVAPPGSLESFGFGAGGLTGVGSVRPAQGNANAFLFTVSQPPVNLNPVAGPNQAVSGSFAYGAGGNQQVGFTIVDIDTTDNIPSADQATLWTGTAASAVYLNPPGADVGVALATDGVNQAGYVGFSSPPLAAAWAGTAASYINLHPAGFDDSTAYGVNNGVAAGTGTDSDQQFYAAILWPTLNAASAIVLRQPTETESQANDVFAPPGGPIRVFGAAYSDTPWHATIWTVPPADPAARTQADLHPAGFFASFINAGDDRKQVGVATVLEGDNTRSRAIYWRNTAASAINLHTFLQASFPNLNNSVAEGFDSAGYIYGRAWQQDSIFPDGDNYVAVRWAPIVLCCRGATCALVPADACVAPAGIGAAANATAESCAVTHSASAGCCYADFDKQSGRTIDDIFIYLNAWFANSPFTRVGGDGTGQRTIDDIFLFLNAWFAGCN